MTPTGADGREFASNDNGRNKGPLERVTVDLTQGASRALEKAVECSGGTRTDAINRALLVYAVVEEALHEGGSIIRRGPDGEMKLTISSPTGNVTFGR